MAVMLRAHHFQRALQRTKLLALQHAADHLGLLDRQRRQVGDGALPDALALANALAQQDRGRGAPVGDDVDVHGRNMPDSRPSSPESSRRIHGYTHGPARAPIAPKTLPYRDFIG